MKRSIGRIFVLAVVSCSVAGLVSVGAYAGYLRQFAAQYLNFDGSEQSTTLAPPSGGQTIYRGTVMVSADVDTLELPSPRLATSLTVEFRQRIRFGSTARLTVIPATAGQIPPATVSLDGCRS
jgi:hypothetical protein